MAASATGETLDAFYEAEPGGVFRSNAATIGPWDRALQHGGPPAALLGRALENQGGPSGSRIARVACDFFSPVPFAQLSTRTEVVRPGSRIQLSSATLHAGDRVVLRATAWHILAEAGRSPNIPGPFVVPPLPATAVEARFPGLEPFPYGNAIEWRFVEGAFSQLGPATVWTRCRIPLVRGSRLTGLQRTLIMVDAANGISAELPMTGWTFVPVDLLVNFERHPEDEWLGMASRTTMGGDGVGITETILFDARGAFGRALQTLYVAPR